MSLKDMYIIDESDGYKELGEIGSLKERCHS